MKTLFSLIIVVIVIGVGYWLVSPIFVNRSVNEKLDPVVERAIEGALDRAGAGLEQAGKAMRDADVTKLRAQAKEQLDRMRGQVATMDLEGQMSGDKMQEFLEAVSNMADEEVKEDMPAAEGEVQILAKGNFREVAHQGSGEAQVIALGGDAGRIVRLEGLDVLNGPDLRVILSKNTNVTSYETLGEHIDLGKLKGNIGTQNYAIPSGVELSQYHSVVIYCNPFKVVFNSAELVRSTQ